MPIRLTDEPTDQDRWRHYHRIFIDGVESDLFSEVFHNHEFSEKGHTHQISISRAYKKVEQEV